MTVVIVLGKETTASVEDEEKKGFERMQNKHPVAKLL